MSWYQPFTEDIGISDLFSLWYWLAGWLVSDLKIKIRELIVLNNGTKGSRADPGSGINNSSGRILRFSIKKAYWRPVLTVMTVHNLISNKGYNDDRTDLPQLFMTWPDLTVARLDWEKHSAVCRNCDSGYRPVNPTTWTGPRPYPLCQYSNKEEDSALLERYKVRPSPDSPGSGGWLTTISSQYSSVWQSRPMWTSIQCARIQWRKWMRSTATGRVSTLD